MNRGLSLVATIIVLGIGLAVGGCGRGSIMSDVRCTPDTISPNADGDSDVAIIYYTISRPAEVSVFFSDVNDNRYDFRIREPRWPDSEPYQAQFGGVIDDRVLPDGTYTYTVEAVGDGGGLERVEGSLTIEGGDNTLPELRNFTVHPTTFTPNRDGVDDRITVNYNLAKHAQVNVYLLGDDGERYPLEEKLGSVKPGEPGNHSYDYEGGVDLGVAPPPDGTYTLVAEALDVVGNRVVETRELTILDGGVPIVEILGGTAEYSHQAIALGQTLTFTVTVANLGAVPVRTSGPPNGTAYTTGQNYNSLGYHEEPGVFRIGLDFEGNSSGRAYPYRWAISDKEYLLPNERFTIVGHLKIVDPPPRINPHYWVGLLHEEVRIVNDHVAPTRITVDF